MGPRALAGHPTAYERITGFLRASQPLKDWLDGHVGPSGLPSR
ncbi:hypothetical protein ABTX81_31415 [Kitasatospora sp. NPDC097605]